MNERVNIYTVYIDKKCFILLKVKNKQTRTQQKTRQSEREKENENNK